MAEIKCDINVDFYCAECGAPICHCANQRNSNYTIIDMEMCPNCKKRYEDEIESLKERIEELEREKNENE